MKMEFLPDGPALVVENRERVLVAGDLHLGIEPSLSRQGVHIRSRSRERIDRLIACIESAGPDMLALLGDIKHGVPFTTRQEMREIRDFFDEIRSIIPFFVLPGNHDPGIEEFLRPDELFPRDGALVDGVGYLHGHTYPNPALRGHLILAGHHHVMVSVRDEVGCALRAAGYLLARVNETCLQFHPGGDESGTVTRALFVPAFCELAGYDIQHMIRDPISPLSRCIDIPTSELFLSDGTFLGPLSLLEEDTNDSEP